MYITGAWGWECHAGSRGSRGSGLSYSLCPWEVPGMPLGSVTALHGGFAQQPAREVRLSPRAAQAAATPWLLGHPSPFCGQRHPLPPPPSPCGVQSVGLGSDLPLCVILICKTTGGDAARIPNLTYGLATSLMHAPPPRTEFPKSESSPAPAEPVPGGIYGGGACQDLSRG